MSSVIDADNMISSGLTTVSPATFGSNREAYGSVETIVQVLKPGPVLQARAPWVKQPFDVLPPDGTNTAVKG